MQVTLMQYSAIVHAMIGFESDINQMIWDMEKGRIKEDDKPLWEEVLKNKKEHFQALQELLPTLTVNPKEKI